MGTKGVDPKVHDSGFSRSGTISALLWAVVVKLIAAAWVVGLWAPESWLVAGLLASTGCATSALAATMQIRVYACRVSRLVRVTSGLSAGQDAQIRSLR